MTTTNKTSVIAETGKLNILIKREFDAPKALVFKAMTDSKAIPQWWGPGNSEVTVDKMDVRFGGTWRFVEKDNNGNEFAFRGVYHVIVQDEMIVQTFEWEGLPNHVIMETMTLEEKDGKTVMTGINVFQTVEDRDGMLQYGMEDGMQKSHDRLEALLKEMK